MTKKGIICMKMTNEKGFEVIEKSMFIYYYLTHEEYGWILIQLNI